MQPTPDQNPPLPNGKGRLLRWEQEEGEGEEGEEGGVLVDRGGGEKGRGEGSPRAGGGLKRKKQIWLS